MFTVFSPEITSCLIYVFQRATIAFQFVYSATVVFICVMIIDTKMAFYCVICSVQNIENGYVHLYSQSIYTIYTILYILYYLYYIYYI
jgi:hypothetical protein